MAVYASGSAVEGFAHAESDIDLYAIVPEYTSAESATQYLWLPAMRDPVNIRIIEAEDCRWDVEEWTTSHFETVLDHISRAGRSGRFGALSDDEAEFACRLCTGTAVIGADAFEELRARMLDSGLREALKIRDWMTANAALEDAAGLLESGDLESATISIRIAASHTGNALVLDSGYLSSRAKDKWIVRRMRRALDSTVNDRLVPIILGGPAEGADGRRAIARDLRTCRALLETVVVRWS